MPRRVFNTREPALRAGWKVRLLRRSVAPAIRGGAPAAGPAAGARMALPPALQRRRAPLGAPLRTRQSEFRRTLRQSALGALDELCHGLVAGRGCEGALRRVRTW